MRARGVEAGLRNGPGLDARCKTRAPDWGKALLRNGLECRSAIGSCKLRFVCRSEDFWFANQGPRKAMKRAAKSANSGGSSAKRQRLKAFCEARAGSGPNALAGLDKPARAPLPRSHELKPIEPAGAGAS